MDRIEYKEGIIIQNSSRISEDLENTILALSAINGKSINETCDWLNRFLQSFESLWDSVKDLIERLGEILKDVSKDICESCKRRRTRHGGGSKAGKRVQAKANIKWQEKYRPP